MKEGTIFEKLGIEYQEVDGIFYPILSVPSEDNQCLNVGKYGRMWIEHIKITYPQRYRTLVRFGRIKGES